MSYRYSPPHKPQFGSKDVWLAGVSILVSVGIMLGLVIVMTQI